MPDKDIQDLLMDIPNKAYHVDDRGFDINAYGWMVQELKYEHFCFLNSYSIILNPGWLEKLHWQVHRNGVGLAGATGSYESFTSNMVRDIRHLSTFQRWQRRIQRRLALRFFPAFPNPHLRTNAFIGSREILKQVLPTSLRWKIQAHAFESGTHGFTRQVQKMGLDVMVVGKDGWGYDVDDWHASNTFRQDVQENLLVADNRTLEYQNADVRKKKYLSELAWGHQAKPPKEE
jgi:hypothetical protein